MIFLEDLVLLFIELLLLTSFSIQYRVFEQGMHEFLVIDTIISEELFNKLVKIFFVHYVGGNMELAKYIIKFV